MRPSPDCPMVREGQGGCRCSKSPGDHVVRRRGQAQGQAPTAPTQACPTGVPGSDPWGGGGGWRPRAPGGRWNRTSAGKPGLASQHLPKCHA